MPLAPTVGVITAGGIYGLGVHRLWGKAGRGHGVSTREAGCFAAGLLALTVALIGPLDAAADDLFAAHMAQHLVLICVTAPLLVLGSPIVAVLWALPASWRSAVGHWWGQRSVWRVVLTALGAPAVVWLAHALVVALWHIPKAYDYALSHESAHAAEHASYVVTAGAFWWTALPRAGARRLGVGASTLYVAAAGAAMGIFGAVLTFAPAPLYTERAARAAVWGLTPIADQQLAGLIMWIPAGIIYLGAALWCFAEWLGAEQHAQRAADRLPGNDLSPRVGVATNPGGNGPS